MNVLKKNYQGTRKRSVLFTSTSFFLFCVLIAVSSCTPADDNERRALDQTGRQLESLPELKEEIEKEKSKVNAQSIEGSFKGSCDGEEFEFNQWNASNSRITFLDFSANIYANIRRKPIEELSIKLVADDWYNKQLPFQIPASLYVMDGTDYLQVTYTKKNENGEIIKTFQTAEGEMIVEAISNEGIRIKFDGEAFVGDIRKQERAPLNFQIDLAYNFVSNDRRTKQ